MTKSLYAKVSGSFTNRRTCFLALATMVFIFLTMPVNVNAQAQCNLDFHPMTMDAHCGACDGSVWANNTTGGTPPYSIQWDSGQDWPDVGQLCPGTYCATVTDANGCTASTCVDILVSDGPNISVSATMVSAEGANDGTATANANGGTMPYTYNWSNGGNTATISGLSPGTYYVTVTDAAGCSAYGSAAGGSASTPGYGTVVITEPMFTISVSVTNMTCGQMDNGSATVTGSGGMMPYSYMWSNGANGSSVNGLSAGMYSVTVTDANGLMQSANFPITGGGAPMSINPMAMHAHCGQCDGSVWANNVVGGTAPYSYQWDSGQDWPDVGQLCAGTYCITVTDANGCTAVGCTEILDTDGPSLTASSTDVSVYGGNDGTATVNGSGGTTPYTYSWSNGGNGQTITGLSPGNYSVTVTDASGCTSTASTSVGQPPNMSITVTVNSTTCGTDADGIAMANVTGGAGPYTYLWSNGTTGNSTNNLDAGNYSVTVTDANDFAVSESFTINQGVVITASVNTSGASCVGENDGSATVVNVNGGNGSYDYEWSLGGMEGNSISNLAPGNYSVTITDMDSGCSIVLPVTISGGSTINVSISTDGTCPGDYGDLTANASGGVAPYMYEWSQNGDDNQTLSNVYIAGEYEVTVTDANGCDAVAMIDLGNGNPLAVTINASGNPCDNNSQVGLEAIVSGGSTGSGGTMPYSYMWSNGSNNQSINVNTPGTYSVTVTDNDTGCNVVDSYNVTPGSSNLSVSTSGINATTFGGNDGTAMANGSGGTMSYSYMWSNGDTGQNINGLSPGNYTVTLTDGNGCTATSNVSISQPNDAMAVTVDVNSTTCGTDAQGVAMANVTGGASPYTYMWSNGGTGNSVNDLDAGNYSVTVTDANNMTATQNFTVVGGIVIHADINTSNAACDGSNTGSANLYNVYGGSGNYDYEWSPSGMEGASVDGLAPGSYSVTITDLDSGCSLVVPFEIQGGGSFTSYISTDGTCAGGYGNLTGNAYGGQAPYTYVWSQNNFNGQVLEDVYIAGEYEITVTDANGCESFAMIDLGDGDPLDVVVVLDGSPCNNAQVGLTAQVISGGSGNFSYNWSTGSNNQSTNTNGTGMYSVTVTDNSTGCEVVENFDLSTLPTNLSVTATGNSNNGTAVAFGSGGVMPYTYAWSNGDTGQTASGLVPGTYTVTVTDALGCTSTTTVGISGTPDPEITVTSTDTDCSGNDNGTATATVSGGVSPYTYIWSNGATSQTITGLGPGDYEVTVTDDDGDTWTGQTTVVNGAITLSVSTTNPSCQGQNDGAATIGVSGGSGNYAYNWQQGADEASLNNLVAGVYTVTVTDLDQNCSQYIQFEIIGDNPITAYITVDGDCGDDYGNLIANAYGGEAPYEYEWSQSSPTNDNQTLEDVYLAGSYQVTVTDANGCEEVASIDLSTGQTLEVVIVLDQTPCANVDPVGIEAQVVSGGSGNYSYVWGPNGETTQGINAGNPGSYSVTVTDNTTGCETIEEVDVFPVSSDLNVVVTGMDASSSMASDGSATATASGGVMPYSYMWNDPAGSTTQEISNLPPGTYSVTVTDNLGCTDVGSVEIGPDDNPPMVMAEDETCVDANDGVAMVTGNGGPYTYLWNDPAGSTTQTVTDLAPGVYMVTVTDMGNNNMETILTVTINEAVPMELTMIPTNIDCANTTGLGAAEVVATGGAGGYTYEWNIPGETNDNVGGLTPGMYSVTVTDANNCTTIGAVMIIESMSLSLNVIGTDIPCDGSGLGTAEAVVLSGAGSYGYTWNTGDTTQTIMDLPAGTYTVTVVDNNNPTCIGESTVTIEETMLNLLVTTTPITCLGLNDGTATITGSGGTMPYSYMWSNAGETTQTITGLSAGMYTVTVTDGMDCTNTASGMVIEPPLMTLGLPDMNGDTVCGGVSVLAFSNYDSLGISGYTWTDASGMVISNSAEAMLDPIGMETYYVEVSSTLNPTCFVQDSITLFGGDLTAAFDFAAGDCSDTVDVTLTNMTVAPFDSIAYEWMYDGQTYTGENPVITIMMGGSMEVTLIATTASGCMDTVTQTISVELIEDVVPDVVACADVETNLNPNFNPAYTYTWESGVSDPNDPNPTVTIDQTTEYMVTVTNGVCTDVQIMEAFVPEPIDLTLSDDIFSCDPAELLNATADGFDVVTYEWFADAEMADMIATGSDVDLNSTAIGEPYYVIATNNFGCTEVDTVLLANASINIGYNDVMICLGDTIELSPIITALPGTVVNLEWTAGTIVSGENELDPIIAPTESGEYSMLISNDFGCSTSESLNVEVTNLNALVETSADFNEDYTDECVLLGEDIQLHVDGDMGYEYTWSPAELLDDANSMDPLASPLETTTFTVEFEDEDGCRGAQDIEVRVLDPECDEPYIFMPNAFTPNGDGDNDMLELHVNNETRVWLIVYTRWGEKVFEARDKGTRWDGTFKGQQLCSDVYGYYLEVDCGNGGTFVKKGNVTLLR